MTKNCVVAVLNENDNTWDLSEFMTKENAIGMRDFLISMPRQNFTDFNVKVLMEVD